MRHDRYVVCPCAILPLLLSHIELKKNVMPGPLHVRTVFERMKPSRSGHILVRSLRKPLLSRRRRRTSLAVGPAAQA